MIACSEDRIQRLPKETIPCSFLLLCPLLYSLPLPCICPQLVQIHLPYQSQTYLFMSSPVHHNHRRRSRSASSPFSQFHHPSDDPNWRVSNKRSRPTYRNSPSYKNILSSQPPEKWDVDLWRRGKRARRDSRVSSVYSPKLLLALVAEILIAQAGLLRVSLCSIRAPHYTKF